MRTASCAILLDVLLGACDREWCWKEKRHAQADSRRPKTALENRVVDAACTEWKASYALAARTRSIAVARHHLQLGFLEWFAVFRFAPISSITPGYLNANANKYLSFHLNVVPSWSFDVIWFISFPSPWRRNAAAEILRCYSGRSAAAHSPV